MSTLALFEGVGIELEYMIVAAGDLHVRPIADRVLVDAGGVIVNELEQGDIAWSNELARHVIEIKTNGPVASVAGLAPKLAASLGRIGELLAPHGARLLGTAMHPWMNPAVDLELWPHDDAVLYATFDRIFGCGGHGWSNLQSMHINLPFQGDDELHRLHSSMRALLPILPALAASSPIVDGKASGLADTRLRVYRDNCRRVPSVTGRVVPEVARGRADYEQRILGRIYDDMAALDPEGVLRHEWVNARGAIARFDRMAVEIRVLDVQEHPRADLAIAAAVIDAVRALTEQRWVATAGLDGLSDDRLVAILGATIAAGDAAVIDDAGYLGALGFPGGEVSARALWLHLRDALGAGGDEHAGWWQVYADQGCLARRIVTALKHGRGDVPGVYRELADCLRDAELFAS